MTRSKTRVETEAPGIETPGIETPSRRATLLVFTLGAAWESRRRRLLPAGWRATEDRLHRACFETALEAGRRAGCRLVVSSPQRLALPADARRQTQSGRGFGERLRRSVREAQRASEGPVVLVGSDIPGLRGSHVEKTLELLREDPRRVVVGPSPDGGFYLLASATPLDEVLHQVRWRCRDTLRSLCRALEAFGREVILIDPLLDLDRRSDLDRWLELAHRSRLFAAADGAAAWRALLVALSTLLASLHRRSWRLFRPTAKRSGRVVVPPLRAPPVSL